MSTVKYLEISPRQTGKTTRMIEMAKAVLAEGRKVAFITPERHEIDWLKQALPGAVFITPEDLQQDDDLMFAEYVHFYDEFDWQDLDVKRLPTEGYYATTPFAIRKMDAPNKDDVLLLLLRRNGNKFERHYWPIDNSDFVKSHRSVLSPDTFRTQILGEFLE